MCKRCIIFTYDEVLDIVMKLEVGAPLNFNPDWPVRTTEAYPKSVAPLIVPAFDTGTPSPYSFLTPETPATTVSAPTSGAATPPTSTSAAESSSTSLPAFAPGSLGVRELSWGFEESWKPGVVFNTRIESATKPTWQESMQHRRCILPVPAFFETHREETYPSPKTGKPIKRQYEFCVSGEDIIFIGCTWRENTFSMVTTDANADMAPLHHRMPLIVRQEELPLWFGPDYQQLADRSKIRLEARPA